MNSQRFLFSLIGVFLVTVVLSSCNKVSTQSAATPSSKNALSDIKTSTSQTTNSKQELKGQDVSDITNLATPDELLYLHDGVTTTYTKDNPKFKEIIQLNNKRQTKKLDACKCMIDKSFQGDYLIYNYTSTNYVPVYFKLVPLPDERFENNLFNYYGSNPIPSDEKNDPTKIEMYGHLAPASELLEYLNSKKLN